MKKFRLSIIAIGLLCPCIMYGMKSAPKSAAHEAGKLAYPELSKFARNYGLQGQGAQGLPEPLVQAKVAEAKKTARDSYKDMTRRYTGSAKQKPQFNFDVARAMQEGQIEAFVGQGQVGSVLGEYIVPSSKVVSVPVQGVALENGSLSRVQIPVSSSVVRTGTIFDKFIKTNPLETKNNLVVEKKQNEVKEVSIEDKVARLKDALKQAGIAAEGMARGPKREEYNALVKEYFAEGLPEAVSMKSLFDANAGVANLFGKSAGALKKVTPSKLKSQEALQDGVTNNSVARDGLPSSGTAKVDRSGQVDMIQNLAKSVGSNDVQASVGAKENLTFDQELKQKVNKKQSAQNEIIDQIKARAELQFQEKRAQLINDYDAKYAEKYGSRSDYAQQRDKYVAYQKEIFVEQELAKPDSVELISQAAKSVSSNKVGRGDFVQGKENSVGTQTSLGMQEKGFITEMRSYARKAMVDIISKNAVKDLDVTEIADEVVFENPRATQYDINTAVNQAKDVLINQALNLPENKNRIKAADAQAEQLALDKVSNLKKGQTLTNIKSGFKNELAVSLATL